MPGVPAGVVATICVPLLETIAPVTEPKRTAVAPARLVPVIVTVVPPVTGPLLGATR